ncbi:MAG: type II secretion system F family protein [Peptococcaceae bacterium]|nr:type II secretion system F family protein [Peptococcaceae bacterium]
MAILYDYRARTADGQQKAGQIEADYEQEALLKLQERGLVVVHLEPSRDISTYLTRSSTGKVTLIAQAVTLKDLAIMSRQFAVLYGAGVSILQSLRTVVRQTQNARLRDLLQQVATMVEAGQGMGESMKRYPAVFPPLLYNMVAAGEIAGSLEEVLNRAATHFEREYDMEQRIRAALNYPKMVVSAMILVGGFLVAFVVPRFADIFTMLGVKLPLPTRILLGMGAFMERFWWVLALIAFAAYISLKFYAKTKKGQITMDSLALRYPIFGDITKKKIVSRFCRSLATLSKSGVPIIPALALVRQTLGNSVFSDALRPAQDAVRMGQGVAAQLEKTGYFPPLVVQMVAVGEETGSFDQMLEKASEFLDAEISSTTDNIAQLLEPIVIGVLAIVVTFIILAIVMPMFDTFRLIG